MIFTAHLIACWTESFFFLVFFLEGWLMRWRGYHLRERGNKTQAHPSFANNRSDRHGLKYLSLEKAKKKTRRGAKTPGTDPRSLKKKKKWERGGSRSCFRQSQLIDRRIEWLFLLHFYSSPLHKRHPWQRSLPVNLFNCLVFPLSLSLSFSLCLKKKPNLRQKDMILSKLTARSANKTKLIPMPLANYQKQQGLLLKSELFATQVTS